MENNTITIAVKTPNKQWCLLDVNNELSVFQNIVQGPIELFYQSRSGILYFCNEEGKIFHLEPNFPFNRDIIVGTVFAVRSDDEGEFISLTFEDIKWFEHSMKGVPVL